jgi:hypothetical protein
VSRLEIRLTRFCVAGVASVIAGASGISGAWAAASPGAHVRCAPVVWRSLRNGDQICPRSHILGADLKWTRLRWTAWTNTQASGRGVQVYNSARNPVRIHLTRPTKCPDGRTIYTRLSFTIYQANGRKTIGTFTARYRCHPTGDS